MPSVKNPNGPSKNRLTARTATARKHSSKRVARAQLQNSLAQQSEGKITKADARRGARAGILPTSGPNKAVSAKRARKLERKLGYALQRKMKAEGEVVMKDVGEDTGKTKTETKTQDQDQKKDQKQEGDATVEMDDISSMSRPYRLRESESSSPPLNLSIDSSTAWSEMGCHHGTMKNTEAGPVL
ncbi:hypothetical protein F4859DRAFT_508085 [Xylaria cf. heliscus]|nr:hypothetical protein F4859DRAFT_508085 [Xylaria cf. heliscus]